MLLLLAYQYIISYQTLFQYHTSTQTGIKNTSWYWEAWDNYAPNKGFNKYTETCQKYTLQTNKTPSTNIQTLYSESWYWDFGGIPVLNA